MPPPPRPPRAPKTKKKSSWLLFCAPAADEPARRPSSPRSPAKPASEDAATDALSAWLSQTAVSVERAIQDDPSGAFVALPVTAVRVMGSMKGAAPNAAYDRLTECLRDLPGARIFDSVAVEAATAASAGPGPGGSTRRFSATAAALSAAASDDLRPVDLSAFRSLTSLELSGVPLQSLQAVGSLRPILRSLSVSLAACRTLREVLDFEDDDLDLLESSASVNSADSGQQPSPRRSARARRQRDVAAEEAALQPALEPGAWPVLSSVRIHRCNMGALGSALRLLPALTLLDTSCDNLGPSISKHLRHCSTLRTLDLRRNQLQDARALRAPPTHALQQSLVALDVSRNALASTAGLECLSSLTKLDVSHNKLGALEELGRLSPLSRLRDVRCAPNPVATSHGSRADWRVACLVALRPTYRCDAHGAVVPCTLALLDGVPVAAAERVAQFGKQFRDAEEPAPAAAAASAAAPPAPAARDKPRRAARRVVDIVDGDGPAAAPPPAARREIAPVTPVPAPAPAPAPALSPVPAATAGTEPAAPPTPMTPLAPASASVLSPPFMPPKADAAARTDAAADGTFSMTNPMASRKQKADGAFSVTNPMASRKQNVPPPAAPLLPAAAAAATPPASPKPSPKGSPEAALADAAAAPAPAAATPPASPGGPAPVPLSPPPAAAPLPRTYSDGSPAPRAEAPAPASPKLTGGASIKAKVEAAAAVPKAVAKAAAAVPIAVAEAGVTKVKEAAAKAEATGRAAAAAIKARAFAILPNRSSGSAAQSAFPAAEPEAPDDFTVRGSESTLAADALVAVELERYLRAHTFGVVKAQNATLRWASADAAAEAAADDADAASALRFSPSYTEEFVRAWRAPVLCREDGAQPDGSTATWPDGHLPLLTEKNRTSEGKLTSGVVRTPLDVLLACTTEHLYLIDASALCAGGKTFADAPLARVFRRHPLAELDQATIGFQLQSLALELYEPSGAHAVYAVLARDKNVTSDMARLVPQMANERRGAEPSTRSGSVEGGGEATPPRGGPRGNSRVRLRNSDDSTLDDVFAAFRAAGGLGKGVEKCADGAHPTVVHYSIVRQWWRSRPQCCVRTLVITDSPDALLLCHEEHSPEKTVKVKVHCLDAARLCDVVGIEVADVANRLTLTIKSASYGTARKRTWRVEALDRASADKLSSALRRCCVGLA